MLNLVPAVLKRLWTQLDKTTKVLVMGKYHVKLSQIEDVFMTMHATLGLRAADVRTPIVNKMDTGKRSQLRPS